MREGIHLLGQCVLLRRGSWYARLKPLLRRRPRAVDGTLKPQNERMTEHLYCVFTAPLTKNKLTNALTPAFSRTTCRQLYANELSLHASELCLSEKMLLATITSIVTSTPSFSLIPHLPPSLSLSFVNLLGPPAKLCRIYFFVTVLPKMFLV